MNEVVENDKIQPLKTLTAVIYGLYGLSFILGGLPSLVAIIMNYVKRDEVAGTWLESHFLWQIRTFWYSLLWGVIGGVLLLVLVGWFVLVADFVWVLYRIIKGWLNLNDGKPMYPAAA
jgi:uncharacterized membrane protein